MLIPIHGEMVVLLLPIHGEVAAKPTEGLNETRTQRRVNRTLVLPLRGGDWLLLPIYGEVARSAGGAE